MSGGEHAAGKKEVVVHREMRIVCGIKEPIVYMIKKTAYLQWHELEILRFKTEQLVD